MTLRAALVGGPMYDGLYDLLDDDVEVVVHADHPSLNREVAARLGAGERIDLLCTHSKYAPSQAGWLWPLDDLVSPSAVHLLAPTAVGLCRFGGALLSVPRNIDVRVLWWRTDRLERPPAHWGELVDRNIRFGFPGRESGLFGTFYELVVANGGRLFDEAARPVISSAEAVDAVTTLCRLAATAPPDLPSWHYDEVDRALLDGRVDAAAAWPGGYDAIRRSPAGPVLAPAPYPAGRRRWVSYAGCHSWAIPRTAHDVEAAAALIERLISRDAAIYDARGGSVPALLDALDDVPPFDAVDAHRREITLRTIAEGMITYPPLAAFPSVEEAGWVAINAALRGKMAPVVAVERIQEAAEESLR